MDKNTNYVVDGLICLNAHERKKRKSDQYVETKPRGKKHEVDLI